MLYEFHRKEKAKKPGSVHATYLITGIRRVESAPALTNGVHSQDGEDTVMQSSPLLPSSSMPKPDATMEEPALIRSVMLVKEEHLDQAKSTFDTISSIHIYSLEPTTLKDVQVLTECNRTVASNYASEDPLQAWKQYGAIQNPNVKRRKRGTAPPPPQPAQTAAVTAKPTAPAAKPKEAADVKVEPKALATKTAPEPDKKVSMKPATTKRQNSDIFKSFAKGKTKPKAEEPSQAPDPDEAMGGFSEDEADDDAAMIELEQQDALPEGKSKKDREAELQAMMAQEDEPMEDADSPAVEPQEPENAIDKADDQKDEEPKENVTVENGRRRGRRRVMKKKTVKDEEGYLGMFCHSCMWRKVLLIFLKSPRKRLLGSPSQRTSQRRRRSRCLRQRL